MTGRSVRAGGEARGRREPRCTSSPPWRAARCCTRAPGRSRARAPGRSGPGSSRRQCQSSPRRCGTCPPRTQSPARGDAMLFDGDDDNCWSIPLLRAEGPGGAVLRENRGARLRVASADVEHNRVAAPGDAAAHLYVRDAVVHGDDLRGGRGGGRLGVSVREQGEGASWLPGRRGASVGKGTAPGVVPYSPASSTSARACGPRPRRTRAARPSPAPEGRRSQRDVT